MIETKCARHWTWQDSCIHWFDQMLRTLSPSVSDDRVEGIDETVSAADQIRSGRLILTTTDSPLGKTAA